MAVALARRERLTRQRPFAKEVAWLEQRHDRFLARGGQHRELHLPRLDVEHAVTGVTLRVDDVSRSMVDDSRGHASRLEKLLEVERWRAERLRQLMIPRSALVPTEDSIRRAFTALESCRRRRKPRPPRERRNSRVGLAATSRCRTLPPPRVGQPKEAGGLWRLALEDGELMPEGGEQSDEQSPRCPITEDSVNRRSGDPVYALGLSPWYPRGAGRVLAALGLEPPLDHRTPRRPGL